MLGCTCMSRMVQVDSWWKKSIQSVALWHRQCSCVHTRQKINFSYHEVSLFSSVKLTVFFSLHIFWVIHVPCCHFMLNPHLFFCTVKLSVSGNYCHAPWHSLAVEKMFTLSESPHATGQMQITSFVDIRDVQVQLCDWVTYLTLGCFSPSHYSTSSSCSAPKPRLFFLANGLQQPSERLL